LQWFRAKAIHEQFASLYTLESLKWDNVAYIAAALGRSRMAAQTFSNFLGEMGIPQKFTNELVEAATRLHYAQVRCFTYLIPISSNVL
jgi:hypothetical protein